MRIVIRRGFVHMSDMVAANKMQTEKPYGFLLGKKAKAKPLYYTMHTAYVYILIWVHCRTGNLASHGFVCKQPCKILASIGIRAGSNLLGCAAGHNGTTAISALRTKINDIIRCFDNVKIVLNDDNGISAVHKAL